MSIGLYACYIQLLIYQIILFGSLRRHKTIIAPANQR